MAPKAELGDLPKSFCLKKVSTEKRMGILAEHHGKTTGGTTFQKGS